MRKRLEICVRDMLVAIPCDDAWCAMGVCYGWLMAGIVRRLTHHREVRIGSRISDTYHIQHKKLKPYVALVFGFA